MAEKKTITEGYQPLQRGHEPDFIQVTMEVGDTVHPAPSGDTVEFGYRPTAREAKHAPVQPPKKP